MWLLDVNLPNGLLAVLKSYGIQCDTTVARGWRQLGNGELASTAHKAGFRVILTRDKVFGESAARALKTYVDLAVVVLTIPQSRQTRYLEKFREAWKVRPISPSPGTLSIWP